MIEQIQFKTAEQEELYRRYCEAERTINECKQEMMRTSEAFLATLPFKVGDHIRFESDQNAINGWVTDIRVRKDWRAVYVEYAPYVKSTRRRSSITRSQYLKMSEIAGGEVEIIKDEKK